MRSPIIPTVVLLSTLLLGSCDQGSTMVPEEVRIEETARTRFTGREGEFISHDEAHGMIERFQAKHPGHLGSIIRRRSEVEGLLRGDDVVGIMTYYGLAPDGQASVHLAAVNDRMQVASDLGQGQVVEMVRFREVNPKHVHGVLYGRELYMDILAHSQAEGIRFYYAEKANGVSTFVLVAVDGEGRDLSVRETEGTRAPLTGLADDGWECPANCPQSY